jgi:hypothetical protein
MDSISVVFLVLGIYVFNGILGFALAVVFLPKAHRLKKIAISLRSIVIKLDFK